nr:YbaK/EbsC family protein [Gammaproteobacteria bacterium]
AKSAHIPAEKMVKAVILGDDDGYVMALVSGDHHVKIHNVNKKLHRNLALVKEDELHDLFADCETGAIPPLGEAYNIPVVIDDDLEHLEDVFIEAGTHSDLLHLSGEDFRKLMKEAKHAQISLH